MCTLSGCYYSPEQYVPSSAISNGLVEVVRDDPSGSKGHFIQFGLHIRNLDSRVVRLEVHGVFLREPNGSIDTTLSPAEVWHAAQKPTATFVATDRRTHDLVWHPSPAQAVTLCLQSVSIAPLGTIDRVVVFPYPEGLALPFEVKDISVFTVEIEGTVSNGVVDKPFPKLPWQANGFRPTIWQTAPPGQTR